MKDERRADSKPLLMFYACWNTADGTELVVHGYEASIPYSQKPWKRRPFRTAYDAREWLDSRRQSTLEDENKELRLELAEYKARAARFEAMYNHASVEIETLRQRLDGRKKQPSNRKPVIVGGVLMKSTEEAARKLGVAKETLIHHLVRGNRDFGKPIKGMEVRYATPAEIETLGGSE